MAAQEGIAAPATEGREATARAPEPALQHDDNHDDNHDHDHEHEHEHAFSWAEGVRIALVSLAAAAVWFRIVQPFHRLDLVGVVGVLIGGYPIFKEAIENIAEKRMTMELSMAIAVIAAAAISEFFSALVITLFVLVAEVLEGMTVSRGRRAIRELLEGLPRLVSVRRADGVQNVAVEDIKVGDAVLVNPGGRMPVDGTVVAGHSFVDQARITGESLPVEKLPGAAVYAGTINQSGALEIRVDRVGRDTSYGKIIEAVERAERSRAPVQRLADRLAGYLVYFALAAAALTFLVTRDIHATISVVIVAGACGIAAGTPLAILGAIGRAAREGAIVKGGLFLESLGRVDTVIFDKTGTLTFGRPEVQAIFPGAGIVETDVLDAAAVAESRSEHPLGQAIVAHARALGRAIVEPDRFDYMPGRGVKASIAGTAIPPSSEARGTAACLIPKIRPCRLGAADRARKRFAAGFIPPLIMPAASSSRVSTDHEVERPTRPKSTAAVTMANRITRVPPTRSTRCPTGTELTAAPKLNTAIDSPSAVAPKCSECRTSTASVPTRKPGREATTTVRTTAENPRIGTVSQYGHSQPRR